MNTHGKPAVDPRGILIASCISLLFWPLSVWSEAQAELAIVPGDSVTKTQHAGESATFVLQTVPDRTYVIEVDQNGLDFIVSITDPQGNQTDYNAPLERGGREMVLVQRARVGAYHIRLRSAEPTDASGTFTIRVSEPGGKAGSSRQLLLRALRSMTEGAVSETDGKLRDAESSLGKFREAARLSGELGDAPLQAQALLSVAMINYWYLYNWEAAADYSRDAADVYGSLDERRLQGIATKLAADALSELANEQNMDVAPRTFAEALDLYDRAYAEFEALGSTYELALVLNNRGLTYFYQGRLAEAAELWRQSAASFATLGEWREEMNSYQNIAVVEGQQGYNARAIATLESALERLPAGADPAFKAILLDNLAQAQRGFGDSEDALGASFAALELYRELGNSRGKVYSLLSIGNAYFQLGELELAQQYLQQALPMTERTNDGRSRAMVYTTLGSIAYLQSEYDQAVDYHRAAVDLSISVPDRAYREILLARDLAAVGSYQLTSTTLNRALVAAREQRVLMTEADALRELGLSYVAQAQPEPAEQYLIKALRMYETLRLELEQAMVLDGLAVAERLEGHFDEAIAYGTRALDILEVLRTRVASPELRAIYASTWRKPFEHQVDLLMARDGVSGAAREQSLLDALTVSERARARMSMDLLVEASMDLDLDLGDEVARRQHELYEELTAKRYQRDRLLQEPVSGDAQQVQLSALLQEMATIETELDIIDAEVRKRVSNAPAFAFGQPLTASEMQQALDSRSALLQYMLADERSYVWVVTSDGIEGVQLAGRDAIEDAARSAYDHLRTHSFGRAASQSRDEALGALAGYVLNPVAGRLPPDIDRVFLSLDGALQFVPFGVLPDVRDGSTRKLVERYDLVNVPSMSVYEAQRRQPAVASGAKTLAIFADPVFERTDPRFVDAQAEGANRVDPLGVAVRSSVGSALTRIAFTGSEAQEIAALVPPQQRLLATGFAASRAAVMSAHLSDYRYLHFATHGLVDSSHPALSALALSMFDRDGQPEDGYLRMHDIYGLKLNADLVVLSACETALGRQVRGEGLIGLTQAFMYAGARSLVVSLWQVPDSATATLMTLFYEQLLEEKENPPEALRQAQLGLASQARWRDPYYWGGFIALGKP